MKFYERSIKKRDKDLKKVKSILKELGVKFSFNWKDKKVMYTGRQIKDRIYVYAVSIGDIVTGKNGFDKFSERRLSKQEFLSTVFHEAGHVLQYLAGEYQLYHDTRRMEDFRNNRRLFERMAKQMYPAEMMADYLGASMMQRYFPEIPFLYAYSGPEGKKHVQWCIEAMRETWFGGKK